MINTVPAVSEQKEKALNFIKGIYKSPQAIFHTYQKDLKLFPKIRNNMLISIWHLTFNTAQRFYWTTKKESKASTGKKKVKHISLGMIVNVQKNPRIRCNKQYSKLLE